MATLMQQAIGQQGTQAFFLPQMMNEALQMIEEAHLYFEHQGRLEMAYLPSEVQMLYASEMSRITMRLSYVMAWCLGQRAVVEGEISDEEAHEHFRLEGYEMCMQPSDYLAQMLPKTMRELSEKTEQLYQRAERLDNRLARH